MMKNVLAVAAGLVVWLLVTAAAGFVLRVSWPAYVQVADAMAFTLPMMIARLAIGAGATVAMGAVSARVARGAIAALMPGVLLLLFFVPVHVSIWEKFPIWYHLTFLLTLVPLTYIGNRAARRSAEALQSGGA
ncbi:MAG TPA: hypothetical protein VFA27_09205 [Vicinamibacterales bacterium]|nr:hypothetical protein [Vicinamibacterales bacterium]